MAEITEYSVITGDLLKRNHDAAVSGELSGSIMAVQSKLSPLAEHCARETHKSQNSVYLRAEAVDKTSSSDRVRAML
ncbi:hypothetical protein E4U15_001791, partial [Claviceps sp. LM218 group G6]